MIPIHYNKRGSLSASAFSAAEKKGLSIIRDLYATDEYIRSTAETLVYNARENDKKKSEKIGIAGVLMLPAILISSCISDEETEPGFCLYDTAKPESNSHADAFQRLFETSDGVRIKRREALLELAKDKFIHVNEFRGGLLSDLAPEI